MTSETPESRRENHVAQRLAFYLLAQPDEEAKAFADAIVEAKNSVHCCKICQNLTDGEVCAICRSDRRDKSLICVVSEPRDVASIERGREYNGTYHVLHGALSPMNHVGPDDIRIKELLVRAADSEVQEVIMATNPDTEGEATAMYISRLLKPFQRQGHAPGLRHSGWLQSGICRRRDAQPRHRRQNGNVKKPV